jgi:hypothetical protein
VAPKVKSAHVRFYVGYWWDERNCYKWDQSVAVDRSGLQRRRQVKCQMLYFSSCRGERCN